MEVEEAIKATHLPLADNWMVQIFILFTIMMLALFIERRFIRKAISRLQKRQGVWDLSVAKAIQRPLAYMIWLVGLSLIGAVLRGHLADPSRYKWLTPIPSIGAILLLNWFLFRLVTNLEKNLIKARHDAKQPVDKTTAGAIRRLLQACIIVLSSLIVLQILHIPISGVLAFGASAGVSLGFASKDLLANFFGTLIIYLDRPFAVGDLIKTSTAEGTVEEIGWRITKLRSLDKRSIYVPNSAFTANTVENCSRMSHRCLNEVIGIRYTDSHKLNAIVDDIRRMLDKCPHLDSTQNNKIALERLGDSGLELRLKAYSVVTDYASFMDVTQNILSSILDIITAHGAELAYPTSTVYEMPAKS